MLIRVFAVVAAQRRLFLVGLLILAVALGAMGLSLVAFVLVLLMFTLALLAWGRYHPVVLFARPALRVFSAAVDVAQVFMAAAFTVMGGIWVAGGVNDVIEREDSWVQDASLSGLWLLLVGFQFYTVWGSSFGVRLSPDGVHNRQPFLASLFVPWEAFMPDYPAAPLSSSQLGLFYDRPELVRRTGLGPRKDSLPATTDANYLAAVVHFYVTEAEHRAAVGTEAELDRLNARLSVPSTR